jgi:hypothetical protein
MGAQGAQFTVMLQTQHYRNNAEAGVDLAQLLPLW